MNDAGGTSGIDQYFEAILERAGWVIEQQKPLLNQAASQMAAVIQHDRRIFLFGSGHSHLIAEEAFFRAGGLAAATPIFSSLVMLHENPALSSRLERTAGLASDLLAPYRPQAGELIFIISNSGVNHLPVEMAQVSKALGLYTIGLCSLAYAQIAPRSALDLRLDQVVDLCLDNGLPPGDGLVALKKSGWKTGPGSTVIGALIWNSLVCETALMLEQAGVDAPVFGSYNMPGSREQNQQLLEKWRKVNPHL
ncbi:MAG: SIS domain-containing protein [Anaerolineales bacterium]|jgi:uncharacterized phosphosugar-binding protein|nr:SIS domain-containing protein [Anaerolineales bacterium]